jgi:RNA polymerase sigma-70 factor (ECF subfamily)
MMDEEKRELITLSKLEGMKYKDIGTIINCSEGAVKVKIFRALKELKDIFQKTKLNHG